MRQDTVHYTARRYTVAQKAEHRESASNWQIYDNPNIYDRVFSERDFEEEVTCFSYRGTPQFALG